MPTLGRGHLKYRDESDMGSVLVVDDDADSRDVVSRLLGRAGYTVRSAVNGRDALIAVTTAPPDVIILDAMMPEMNGVEFLQVIRSYLRWSTLPVILLTAYPQARTSTGPRNSASSAFSSSLITGSTTCCTASTS